MAWIPADELRPGDRLVGSNGETLTVLSIDIREKFAGTYNFEVNDWHTYFVTQSGPEVWVHNASKRRRKMSSRSTKKNSSTLPSLARDPEVEKAIRKAAECEECTDASNLVANAINNLNHPDFKALPRGAKIEGIPTSHSITMVGKKSKLKIMSSPLENS